MAWLETCYGNLICRYFLKISQLNYITIYILKCSVLNKISIIFYTTLYVAAWPKNLADVHIKFLILLSENTKIKTMYKCEMVKTNGFGIKSIVLHPQQPSITRTYATIISGKSRNERVFYTTHTYRLRPIFVRSLLPLGVFLEFSYRTPPCGAGPRDVPS